jgi:hypothetical protein
MTRSGTAFQLAPLAPLTAGIESGLWRTPQAGEGNGGGQDPERRKAGGHSVYLRDQVKAWPTPTAQDASNDGGPSQFERNSLPLNAAVKLWPTPHGICAPGPRRPGPSGNELGRAVNLSLTKDGLWTTPAADDTGHRKEKYAQGGTALSAQAGGSLNPTWVEWLMGFPLGWTDCELSATRSSRRSRSGSAGESSNTKAA